VAVCVGGIALLGVGAFVLSADPSRRALSQGIFIWHLLVFVVIAMKADDFTMSLVNWYTLSIFTRIAGSQSFTHSWK
jgi:hypothetical protein